MVKKTMVKKMGRIKDAPRLMAMLYPALAPMIWPAAIQNPAEYRKIKIH